MLKTANPFATLLDSAAILQACDESGALKTLPVSVRHCADRAAAKLAAGLAEHDAAVEAVYRQAIEKAARPAPARKRAKPETA